jgi:hypothetical protein
MDELSPNNLFALDSLAPSGAWKTLPVSPPAPLGTSSRWGQRFLSWGSSLFMYGGITTQAPQTFRQDLLALELTQLLNPGMNSAAPPGWNTVSNTDPTTGITPGFPPGRIGPSWTGYTVGALMFGGVATRDGSAPYPKCFVNLSPSNPAPPECFFHHHVWACACLARARARAPHSWARPQPPPPPLSPPLPPVLPGSTDWFVPVNGQVQKYDSTAWIMLNEAGANNGPVPAGRTEHCAGNLGDQLYIYGGYTATGPVTPADALWTYNLASQTWVNLPAQNPAPSIGYRGSAVTGTFIAHHFYAYVENYDVNNGIGGQLWRWSPNNAALPPGVAYPAPYNASGHTAGACCSRGATFLPPRRRRR